MWELFGYEFFRNAIIAGICASVLCGVIGTFVVVKRMVSVSGGLSHAAFGGVGIGYYLGIDPLAGAVAFTSAISLLVGAVREKAGQQMDILIGAVWAFGMALGIMLIALSPGYAPDLFSFLFGNILLIPTSDLILMGLLVLIICGVVFLFYQQLIAVTFDEEYARIMNLPVTALSLLLILLIALTVVMLIRVVGIILVIALLTLPAAISREYTRDIALMMYGATVAGIACTMGGLFLSYFFDVPSGATIIMLCTAGYAVMLLERHFFRRAT